MTVEIGDTPMTEVRLDVDAGVQIVPPEPSAASRYPLSAVVDDSEMFFPLVVVVRAIGSDAERVDADTELERVWNSLISIHWSVGSTGEMSESNSS
jgi:hypothetical protein